MKALSKRLNPKAAIASLLSAATLLTVSGGIVGCTPGGDEGVKEANENIEEQRNEADDDNDGEARNEQNEANQDDDD